MNEFSIPAYVSAANSHTILNNPDDRTIGEVVGDTITGAGKFAALSVGSGLTEAWNTIPTVGNWFGGEFERVDFKAAVADYDDDLAKYYTEHQLGIDTVGFIMGSLVPGMLGVKALNAGQTAMKIATAEGTFGSGFGKALGLLTPKHEQYLAEAIKQIRVTGNPFSILEANTLKAIGAGFGQQALEAAAFETAVAATMHQSPILKDMDASDLMWNGLIGVGLGGAIGGSISGLFAAGAIKQAGKAAANELLPWTIREVPVGVSTSDKILNYTEQLRNLPEVPVEGELAQRIGRTADQTKANLNLKIREELGNLAGGDQVVAQAMFDGIKLSHPDKVVGNFIDSTAVGRASAVTEVEKELNKITDKIKKQGGLEGLSEEELDTFGRSHVTWVKVRGEGAGDTTFVPPDTLSLTDKLKPGESITISKDLKSIKVGNKTYAQENNVNRPFNILGVSHYQVEARRIWSEMLPKWDDSLDLVVHEMDLPLLEKAARDGIRKLKVIPEGGAVDEAYLLSSREDILGLVKSQKLSIAKRLEQALPKETSVDVITDKLKNALGINFNVGITEGIVDGVITLDRTKVLARSLADTAKTIKREEGRQLFQTLLDARGIGRLNLEEAMPRLAEELKTLSKKLKPTMWKGQLPEVNYKDLFGDAMAYFSRNPDKIKAFPELSEFSSHLLKPMPQEVIDSIAKRAYKATPSEIAKIVNVQESLLRGEVTDAGWFARDAERALYKQMMEKAGTRTGEQVTDPMLLPSWIKVISRESRTKDIDGNLLQGMTAVAERARLYEDSATRIAVDVLGEELPELSLRDIVKNISGGQGFLGFENSAYGSAGSVFSYVGQRTHNLIKKARDVTSEYFTPTLHGLANDLNAAIEWSTLNETMRSLPQAYRLAEDGTKLVLYKNAEKLLAQGVPEEIAIKSPLVQELVAKHINANGTRINKLQKIRANEGLIDNRDASLFYPIPRNTKDTPYFAFVVDDTVTGTGHNSMIYAANEKDLVAMKNDILQKAPHLKVLTKEESEQYFKSHGQFSFERSLSERNINWELKRSGVSFSKLPVTDPAKIVSDFMDWHLGRDSSLIREAVSHRYSRQFETLRASAGESIQASKSKFGYSPTYAYAESNVNDPAMNLIKMALDIQRTSDFPFWNSFNKMLDEKVSSVWQNVERLWQNATTPDHLSAVNGALKEAGYGDILVDEAMYRVMNNSVPRGTLTSAINKMNGLLATFALRIDPLNALNNLVGSSVLLGTELRAVQRAIGSANPAAAGELAKITSLTVPGSKGAQVLSPTKLIANSISRYHNNPELKLWYKKHGFISTITEQYDQTLDALAIKSTDSIDSLNQKIANAMKTAKKYGDKGEALTGNKFAEEFNRFVAADVMKQITDVAVNAGAMTEKQALTYINTFVNRTQGNYIAAQRPMLFQGPVGQAIGLFQTYQFNLIQQLLRHVQDGNLKNAATMMGLQGTVYGFNGLPAFNAINTHIIGNAAGNENHTDLYQAAYSAAGKEAGDWLVYGGLSNALGIFHPDLKMNMYTRGDINPRSLTLVPTDPSKVPIVQSFTKLISNLSDIGKQTAAGGDMFGAFMRALEHNGVSRPLAGMAQVLEGAARPDKVVISTSNKDNMLMAHDLMSLSSLVRLAGGKPLDEALVNDAMFRINTYKAKDSARMDNLGAAIKISNLSGSAPDEQQLNSFMESYVSAGGNQANFSKFMARQYKNINASQAEQLRTKLSSPYAIQLQRILGGYEEEE